MNKPQSNKPQVRMFRCPNEFVAALSLQTMLPFYVLHFVVGGTETDSTSMCFQPLALHKVKVNWPKYLQAEG